MVFVPEAGGGVGADEQGREGRWNAAGLLHDVAGGTDGPGGVDGIINQGQALAANRLPQGGRQNVLAFVAQALGVEEFLVETLGQQLREECAAGGGAADAVDFMRGETLRECLDERMECRRAQEEVIEIEPDVAVGCGFELEMARALGEKL